MRQRRGFNRKRRICGAEDLPQDLRQLADRVAYGGNPEHKRNPGDFGLTPPSRPRPDKSLCDGVGIFERKEDLRLLRQGIRRGWISAAACGGFPQNVWTVTADGHPLEAQLENADKGAYHGYPLPEDDPMHEVILREWKKTGDQRGSVT
jgi:hypothetical protein